MLKVSQLCSIGEVTRETLYYYEKIYLLVPIRTENNYRLYDDNAIKKLQQIQTLRKNGFNLKQINAIINNPNCNKKLIVEAHIKNLEAQKEEIERNISFAKNIEKEL